jgi:hypothetical protein
MAKPQRDPPFTDKPETLHAARASKNNEGEDPQRSADADLAGSPSEPTPQPPPPPQQPAVGPPVEAMVAATIAHLSRKEPAADNKPYSSIRKACCLVRNVRHRIGNHFSEADWALWQRSADAVAQGIQAWRLRPREDKKRFDELVAAMRAEPKPLDRATPAEISRDRQRRISTIAFAGWSALSAMPCDTWRPRSLARAGQ